MSHWDWIYESGRVQHYFEIHLEEAIQENSGSGNSHTNRKSSHDLASLSLWFMLQKRNSASVREEKAAESNLKKTYIEKSVN